MEALAALGLAANVIQFVQFACELVSLSSNIRGKADGDSFNCADLRLIGQELEKHHEDLAIEWKTSASLQELADRAREAALDLKQAIIDLKKPRTYNGNKSSRWRCFRHALKIIWSKDKIDALQSRLESLRGQLQYHLITETWHIQSKVQGVLQASLQDQAMFESTVSEKLDKITSTLNLISERFSTMDRSESSSELEDATKKWKLPIEKSFKTFRILQSLTFPTMTVRHSAIMEAHGQTFEWIFKSAGLPAEDHRSGVRFSSWLEQGSGLYWIKGKPGSGKSTLMKFLEDHATTGELLTQWAQPLRLVRASFYFWSAGTHMQKSLEGLLQSLLYEILSNCPELIESICSRRWESKSLHSDPWDLPELQDAFDTMQSLTHSATKFYFHVDGLDEYNGDHYMIVDIIEKLARLPSFKICVSSRPWNVFQHTIGQSNNGSLQLHAFTVHDITTFARDTMIVNRILPIKALQGPEYDQLIGEIVQRAQGVFLWVRLVVSSLRNGIVNGDPISLLRKRLEGLPDDLEKFFDLLMRSVDPVYGERMARTFLTAMASPEPLRIVHYSFLDEEDPYLGWTMPFLKMEEESLAERIAETRWRLNGRYKGLLEPATDSDSPRVTVDFLHRTLRDFLGTAPMKLFLESRAPPNFNPIKAAIGAWLGEAKTTNKKPYPRHFAAVIQFAYLEGLKRKDFSLEYHLLDHVELVCESSYPRPPHMAIFPHGMLTAAVHHRHNGYVKYRVSLASLSVPELNWILVHYLLYAQGESWKRSFDAMIRHGDPFGCNCVIQPWRKSFDTEMVGFLLQNGAEPNAERLHHALGCTPGDGCQLPTDMVSFIKAAIPCEIQCPRSGCGRSEEYQDSTTPRHQQGLQHVDQPLYNVTLLGSRGKRRHDGFESEGERPFKFERR
ncbi:hypothetical protein P171DRAFT_421174 [Karstenula rhodostoma CBS 690.94]|uniref:NACHT domain-containing protein n=1 Tax=Karstenula rhodostoma CBS 690.94 TaxID=1392251 RepID=A0A9P4U6A1_9PLEO|nr:hypothetical protein P171DRAFT_421174 [Karstenula rhodostoma CBS 690.94]